MGKNKPSTNLGKSIIKDRFGRNRRKQVGDSFIHTTELDDGYEWGRLNLQSVTERSNLDEFLATAEMAGTDFTAEKLNISIVDRERDAGLLTKDEETAVMRKQSEHRQMLKIPRRPPWDKDMTAEALDQRERESYLQWRRDLSVLQEIEGIMLTPFERNLDFWRQLWRVIERSDVVVQIVDARNPLLFRCADLEVYVNEVDMAKVNLLLVNKADLLSSAQRRTWYDHFREAGVRVAFWSAVLETERIAQEKKEASEQDEAIVADSSDADEAEPSSSRMDEHTTEMNSINDALSKTNIVNADDSVLKNLHDDHEDVKVLDGHELVALFKTLHSGKTFQEGVTTIGLVGYPNVGKSSTINAILQTKKVPVSATPGRTKHFQTLYVESDLLLCDCPGLVMPSFVATKAEMVVSGILPIDQMRDCVPPVALVCRQMGRETLSHVYGLLFPPSAEGEPDDQPPTAYQLMGAYARMRGFMTHKGIPDFPRAARLILKDYVSGKLLYAQAPPNVTTEAFQSASTTRKPMRAQSSSVTNAHMKDVQFSISGKEVDASFFTKPAVSQMGSKGIGRKTSGITSCTNSSSSLAEKTWKKHGNQNKKEKLRRLHAHLDA